MTTDHAHDAVEHYDGNFHEMVRDLLAYVGHETSDRNIDGADIRFIGEFGHAFIDIHTWHPLEGSTVHSVRLDGNHAISGAIYAALAAADRKDTPAHAS